MNPDTLFICIVWGVCAIGLLIAGEWQGALFLAALVGGAFLANWWWEKWNNLR